MDSKEFLVQHTKSRRRLFTLALHLLLTITHFSNRANSLNHWYLLLIIFKLRSIPRHGSTISHVSFKLTTNSSNLSIEPHNLAHLNCHRTTILKPRSRHVYLAGAVLDDDESILADGAGLLGVGLWRPCISLRLEVVLLVRHGEPSSKTRQAKEN